MGVRPRRPGDYKSIAAQPVTAVGCGRRPEAERDQAPGNSGSSSVDEDARL